MATYRIDHLTTYSYAFPAGVSAHLAHLHPRVSERQVVHSWSLDIQPEPNDLNSSEDFFGNATHFFSVQELHQTLSVRACSEVSVEAPVLPAPGSTPSCKETRRYLKTLSPRTTGLVEEFRFPSPFVPLIPEARAYAEPILRDEVPLLEAAINLSHAIYSEFDFDPKATDVSTPIETVLEMKRGVCQDFAHLMLACLRSHGLPALYISGYILTNPPPGSPRLIGADASHAWVSLYIPEHGWVDIDPTNDKLVTDEHITVARGRDYDDVSPIRGAIVGGGKHELDIQVTVTPLKSLAPVQE